MLHANVISLVKMWKEEKAKYDQRQRVFNIIRGLNSPYREVLMNDAQDLESSLPESRKIVEKMRETAENEYGWLVTEYSGQGSIFEQASDLIRGRGVTDVERGNIETWIEGYFSDPKKQARIALLSR